MFCTDNGSIWKIQITHMHNGIHWIFGLFFTRLIYKDPPLLYFIRSSFQFTQQPFLMVSKMDPREECENSTIYSTNSPEYFSASWDLWLMQQLSRCSNSIFNSPQWFLLGLFTSESFLLSTASCCKNLDSLKKQFEEKVSLFSYFEIDTSWFYFTYSTPFYNSSQ